MSAFSPVFADRSHRRTPAARARQLLDVALLAGAIGFVAIATIGGVGPGSLETGASVVAVSTP